MASKASGVPAASASTAQPGSIALDLAIDAGLALAADRQRQQNLTEAAAQTAINEADVKTAVERLRELLAARAVLVAEHTVTQAALSADDRKWRLSEVVARAYADDPQDERLAAVLEVLTAADPELAAVKLAAQRVKKPAPVILGPGTDAPGHPDWCADHDAETGDGTSTCFGDEASIGDARVKLCQTTGQDAEVWLFLGGQDEGERLSAGEAREYARELRQVADLLEALADQADAGSAVTA